MTLFLSFLHLLIAYINACYSILLSFIVAYPVSNGFFRPNTTLCSVATGLKKPLLAGQLSCYAMYIVPIHIRDLALIPQLVEVC